MIEDPPQLKKKIGFLSLVTAPAEVISATGLSLSKATSFFYKKNKESVYLVTNWHVVTGRHTTSPKTSKTGAVPTTLRLKVHKDIGNKISMSQKLQIELQINDEYGNKPEWMEHHLYKYRVDVAVIRIDNTDGFMDEVRFNCLQECAELRTDFVPSAMDDVFVMGYPWGLTGGDPVLPLYKRGSVASEPAVDYNNLPCFLIDCRTARSMSGSPVLCSHSGIWNPTGKLDGSSAIGTVMNFAGVYSGRLRDPDPERNAGLGERIAEIGIVWKREVLDEIVEHGVVGTKLSELE